jgi:hypothetical protein
MVANFLYGVAYRTAQQARRSAARRKAKEAAAPPRPEARPDPWEGVREALDRELTRLPDSYRAPLVLCDLEGRTRTEAAQLLGCPEGTIASRLARSRKLLARRMSRYGVSLAGGVWATIVSKGMACPPMPPSLMLSTTRAVTGTVSVPVAALTQGVLRTMLLAKLKIAAALVLVLSLVSAGLALTPSPSPLVVCNALGPPIADHALAQLQEAATPAAAEDEGDIKGTTARKTKEFDLSGFTAVDVSSAFHVEITHGDGFKTAVTAEEDILPLIQVTKEGNTLKVRLENKGRSIHSTEGMKVTITMPALEAVTFSGATHGTFKGFKSAKEFTVKVHGASHLEGDIEAAKLNVTAEGASRTTLKGSVKEAQLHAAGASQVQMPDATIDSADIALSGASQANINVKSKLDYTLSGASHLTYSGNPTVGHKKTSGASSASRK